MKTKRGLLNLEHFLAWLHQMQYNMLTSKAIKKDLLQLIFQVSSVLRQKYCPLAVIYEFYIRPHLRLHTSCSIFL